MANWLSNPENVGTGWKAPGDFQAPTIGNWWVRYLANKLLRDKMTQENIADTIKNVRGERQADKYLRLAKEWGIVPADYEAGGVGGAAYGSNLAKQIEAQRRTTLESEQQGIHEAVLRSAGGTRTGLG